MSGSHANGHSKRNADALEEPFTLTVDQYGRLWLHTKIEGIEVAIDLAEKGIAFGIMAAKMAEYDFDFRPVPSHDGEADNDDQIDRWVSGERPLFQPSS